MRNFRLVAGICGAMAGASVAMAQDGQNADADQAFSLGDVALDTKAVPMERFGTAGQEWFSIGAGAGFGAKDAGIYGNLYVSYEQFLADDFEVVGLLEGWSFDQDFGDDGIGAGVAIDFRYHFWNEDRLSVFASLGIGMVFTNEKVPADGGDINFTPRAGVGMTYLLDEATATRLLVGLRWQHVSNARINGAENNPGRDAAMLYAGVMFPF